MWLFDYWVWSMLQVKFMMPAQMMTKGGEMEEFVKRYSLNGVKAGNICKPY